MKKIFSIVMVAALVAFSITSCKKNGQNEPENPQQQDSIQEPVDTTAQDTTPAQDTTQVNPGALALAIEVSDITATTAYVTITPSDTTAAYFCSYVSLPGLAEYEMTLDEYAADDMDYYPTSGYTFDELATYGTVAGEFEGLKPETEYYAYAFYFNEKFEIIGEVNSVKFKTAALEVSETVALNLTDAQFAWEFDDEYGDGTLYLDAVDEAKNLMISFYLLSVEPEGTFTADNIYDPWAAFGYYYNATTDLDTEEQVPFVVLEITGSFNDDKSIYTFGGYAVNTNGVKYTFADVQATEYVESDDDMSYSPKKKNAIKNQKRATKTLKKLK